MEIFKNKFLIKLIATLCLFLALISFAAPTTVKAAKDDDGWGGVLITPVVKLLSAIGDGIMELLHKAVQSQGAAIIKIEGSEGNFGVIFMAVAIGLLVAVGIIGGWTMVVAPMLAELGLGVATAISLGTITAGAISGTVVGLKIANEFIPEDIYLPAFTIGAEQIFSNELPLFDVNFFNAEQYRYGTEYKATIDKENPIGSLGNNSNSLIYGYYSGLNPYNEIQIKREVLTDIQYGYIEQIVEDFNNHNNRGRNIDISSGKYFITVNKDREDMNSGNTTYEKVEVSIYMKEDNSNGFTAVYDGTTNKTFENGVFTIGCTEEILLYEAKIIEEPIVSTAMQLKDTISLWYYILKNIALLVLMVVLIYSGIRIVLSSTAGEKAKYKERLVDWIVAMCLIFVMQYIMVFAVNIVEKITDLVSSTKGEQYTSIQIPLSNTQLNNAKKIDWSALGGLEEILKDVSTEEAESGKAIVWNTDLVGLFKIQSQLENEGTSNWVGYTFCYVVLILFTLFFAMTYLKRIVYIAFLTMMAPLVAMTYPIDKITDGKAQAFNAWLKEYIFNLMIQPLHLLLYTILVTSAFELAGTNPIYAIVAIGFMMPAEKLMRKFFGFEKASTPGLLGGAAGAALAMTGINKVLGHRPKGGSSGGKSSGENESKDSAKINFKSKDAISGMKGIAREPTENVQEQDSEDAKIRTNGPETEGRRNPRINPSGAADDHSALAEDIFEDMYGPDPNVSRAADDHSSLAEDIFEDMYGPDPNVSRAADDHSSLIEDMYRPNQNDPAQNEPSELESNNFNQTDWGRQIKGTIASSGAYYRALGKRIGDKIQNGHPIRAMARGAAGLVGAATFGAAGLAMGVVSGDPSKAFQYASAGALGGHKLASSTVGAVQKATTVDEDYLKEQYELAAYGDEYKKYKLEEEKKKMQESEKYINYLQKTMSLSRDDAKKVLYTTGTKCFDSGITNVEDIATIHKMTQGKDGISINEAIGAKKFNDLLPSDVSKMDADKRKKYVSTWEADYRKAGYGSKSGDWAQKSMDYAIKFADIQSSLKKSQV